MAADSSEKRRRDPPSQTRVGEKEKRRVRSPSPRPTSAASSGARLPQETSTPSRRDETDKSVKRSKDESPVRRTPAKKKRARKISSDSGGGGSGSGSSSDSSSSSSSEDEAMAENKVIDKSEEEQLRVLEAKRRAHKRLKSRMREKATRRLIRKAKRYEAALRKSQETKKEAEEREAEQQEEEAVEAVKAESSEADLAAKLGT